MRATRLLRRECGASLSCPTIHDTDDPDTLLVQGPEADPALRATLGVPDHERLIEMPRTMLAATGGDPMIRPDQLDEAILSRFTRDLFRVETLPYYAADAAEYRLWQRGEPGPDLAGKRGWLGWIADQAATGRTLRRLRIVRGPLTDYELYEMGWCYVPNARAGEECRILDLTEQPLNLPETGDFYVIDGTTVLRMHYDRAGELTGGDIVQRDAAAHVALSHLLWHTAEPFATWWARHPSYQRTARAA